MPNEKKAYSTCDQRKLRVADVSASAIKDFAISCEDFPDGRIRSYSAMPAGCTGRYDAGIAQADMTFRCVHTCYGTSSRDVSNNLRKVN